MAEMDDDLPVVRGLTETSAEGLSLPSRLTALLAQRPGSANGAMSRALAALEEGYQKEPNPKLRARIAAARAMLLEGPCDHDD